jgi:hypothetical protein
MRAAGRSAVVALAGAAGRPIATAERSLLLALSTPAVTARTT